MEPIQQPRSSFAIPVAIVFGFAMIAIAIFFTTGQSSETTPEQITAETEQSERSGTPKQVTGDDYIRGNPNAPILLIEYADYDCPFCKRYHETLSQIMDEYGVTGRVAWVYRQLPLAQLHPNAPKISQAALCVGKLGGNDAFWKFTDQVYEERSEAEYTNVTKIPDYVEQSGVDIGAYTLCMDNGETEEELMSSLEDAYNIGAQSTPYTVLVVGNQQAVIDGARSYETVKSVIENLLAQLDGTSDVEPIAE